MRPEGQGWKSHFPLTHWAYCVPEQAYACVHAAPLTGQEPVLVAVAELVVVVLVVVVAFVAEVDAFVVVEVEVPQLSPL
jgi:hypothetical protein